MNVLFVVIDAATPRVVCPAIHTGRLPTFQRLVAAGTMHEASTTIFPSITPAATTALITGAYPAQNGIAGASWYDEATKEVAYYGDDFWVIARKGFRAFLEDFLLRLNGDRLRVPTLFEYVEQQGRLAGCLNYLEFRGPHRHEVNVPWLLALLPGVPLQETICGPTVLCLGDFVATRTLRGRKLGDKGGLLHRFGMDDASTGVLLQEMAEDGAWPDLTVAYFADNDYRSHEVGPHDALPVIEHVDAALAKMFDAAGGMERFLSNTMIVITSDHGHTEILADADRAVIYLDRTLADFRQAELGGPWKPEDEILVCPNMRAAEIYLREVQTVLLDRVVTALGHEPRVDQVLWRAPDTPEGESRYMLFAKGERLQFWRGTDGSQSGRDAFGITWSWRGDLAAIDADVQDDRIVWSNYPNAFERIAGVLDREHGSAIWITAVPGCEFEVEGGRAHVGGASHGALHALDSFCPVIVAGPRTPARLPVALRSVDITPMCLEWLGLASPYAVGAPRTERTRRER
ncbi:MAG: alkaline phosphatase family protein [Vicinamibacterales bacterium]